MESYKEHEYLTYNGMNRPALIAGVPIMFCIGIMGLLMFLCLPLFVLFGIIVGTIPTVVLVAAFITVRTISENDPNALYVLITKTKGQILFGFKRILGVRG